MIASYEKRKEVADKILEIIKKRKLLPSRYDDHNEEVLIIYLDDIQIKSKTEYIGLGQKNYKLFIDDDDIYINSSVIKDIFTQLTKNLRQASIDKQDARWDQVLRYIKRFE